MSQIHIHREHHLGLAKARKIAWSWAEEVEEKFDMACTVIEGQTEDTVEFKRTGVSGTLTVTADHFDLDAKLGFLLGAFAKTIEAEITKNLDALLSRGEKQAQHAKADAKSHAKATAKAASVSAAKHPATPAKGPRKPASKGSS